MIRCVPILLILPILAFAQTDPVPEARIRKAVCGALSCAV